MPLSLIHLEHSLSSSHDEERTVRYAKSAYEDFDEECNMDVIRDLCAMHEWRACRAASRNLGFVPTMGYLHDGHMALCRAAKNACEQVVVSIFVNPTQFGPNEDLDRYPRDEKGDLAKLRTVGVDAVFLPRVEALYPPGCDTRVHTGAAGRILCGARRPGHFDGVATIVTKFFHIIQPTHAFFGLKDYQQYCIIKKIVSDLNMKVEIVGVPTVREQDGLAMSSRNAYLSDEERRCAHIIPESLEKARVSWDKGERDVRTIEALVRRHLEKEKRATIEYVSAVDGVTLGAPQPGHPVVVALALRIGTTRLIDNIVLRA